MHASPRLPWTDQPNLNPPHNLLITTTTRHPPPATRHPPTRHPPPPPSTPRPPPLRQLGPNPNPNPNPNQLGPFAEAVIAYLQQQGVALEDPDWGMQDESIPYSHEQATAYPPPHPDP